MEKVRLSFDVTPKLSEKVENLSNELQTTKSDVLRKAIELLNLACGAKEKGMEFVISDGEKVTSIILL